jgi:hypothetical protein
MSGREVEWVLVVHYGSAAHRATYGRLSGTTYTKDYLQLSRLPGFLETVRKAFSVSPGKTTPIKLIYKWPKGTAKGEFVFISADRPHLKWVTRTGAPKAWRMTPSPDASTEETIPGDPSRLSSAEADKELEKIGTRGAGQPYLFAVKLKDEPDTLHLRVFLKDPNPSFSWADIQQVPNEVRSLAAKTSSRRALAWKLFDGSSRPEGIIKFDPNENHGAWGALEKPKTSPTASSSHPPRLPVASPSSNELADAESEQLEFAPELVSLYNKQIVDKNYAVPDKHANSKTRGSAQRAFAQTVKSNYGYRCAVTGIQTREFLVAAHIVPWSEDETIRLDPSNGICLSLIVDRAFETGYLYIEDDLTLRVDRKKLETDKALSSELQKYDGKKLREPSNDNPRREYLERRRDRFRQT